MTFGDSFFKKIEKKTNVNKETILALANKLQQGNMKDEENLRDLIKEVGTIAGKGVTKEKEDKIINAIISDKVPKDIEKFVD